MTAESIESTDSTTTTKAQGPAPSPMPRSGGARLERQVRALIEQRPVVAVLTAAGVGYAFARLVARGAR